MATECKFTVAELCTRTECLSQYPNFCQQYDPSLGPCPLCGVSAQQSGDISDVINRPKVNTTEPFCSNS